METGTEGDGTLVRVDLDVTEGLVEVGGDDDIDRLDRPREGLVQVLLGDLQLEQSTVDLVDDDDGLDPLTQGLAQHGLGLDTDTLDTVDDDEGTVGDTESGRDLGGEVDVTGRVDQVDQELVTVDLLGNVLEVVGVGQVGVEGDGRGFDGDTTFLLILTRIGETGLTSLRGGNNTSTLDQRVGQGRLSVVDYTERFQSDHTTMRTPAAETTGLDVPWAMTDMFRMLAGRSIKARICLQLSGVSTAVQLQSAQASAGQQTNLFDGEAAERNHESVPRSMLMKFASHAGQQGDEEQQGRGLLDHLDGFFLNGPRGGVVR